MTSKRSKEINAANASGHVFAGDSDLSDSTDHVDDNDDDDDDADEQKAIYKSCYWQSRS